MDCSSWKACEKTPISFHFYSNMSGGSWESLSFGKSAIFCWHMLPLRFSSWLKFDFTSLPPTLRTPSLSRNGTNWLILCFQHWLLLSPSKNAQLDTDNFSTWFLQHGNILIWFFWCVFFNIMILPLLPDNLLQLLLVLDHYCYYLLQFFQPHILSVK